MCGIVGYIGARESAPIIVSGLQALEYRGYDSAGLAVQNGALAVLKKKGRVQHLAHALNDNPLRGQLGIGHTRWATHGAPSALNAHPHFDCTERVCIVHNGIIENYGELRKHLLSEGHSIVSQTDSEIIAHVIEQFLENEETFESALFSALSLIRGTYALAVLDGNNPDTLYAARLGSPLIIGIGEDEFFLASDPAAIVQATKDIVHLNDGEVAIIRRNNICVRDLSREEQPVSVEHIEWSIEQAQKGNFPHFMLKEIHEGPDVVRATLNGRLRSANSEVKLGGFEDLRDELGRMDRLLILACGTSYYAGLVGEYIFEEITGLPVEVHVASEFRYRQQPFSPTTGVLAISQSGETADTLAALRCAREAGLLTLGLVNVVGSTIARETDGGIYNHAGPEIGVASTKAFLSQLTALSLMALYLAPKKNGLHADMKRELLAIPEKIEEILATTEEIHTIANSYTGYRNFLFLGRRYNFPVALEGALKLKEISYLHAEGYGAGEMKHGPIAMIGPDFPTIAIMPSNGMAEKMRSNIEEIRARDGRVLIVTSIGDTRAHEITEDVIYVPETIEPLEPLLTVVPLQLFAYYIGTALGYDVDRPRNLAKSVTVE